MLLKVRDIIDIMEDYAPSYLKENYDNVGLMVGNSDDEVNSILVALDCTFEIIKEAVKKDCNLIITHHPLLFIKPKSITADTLQGRKITELIRNNINLYSSHTNLDIVSGGLNDSAAELLGYSKWTVIEHCAQLPDDKKHGVGRLVELEQPSTLGEICEKVKRSYNIQHLRYAGNENMTVKRIAVINGSGEDYFESAVKLGADCIITGDTTYHYVSDYSEMGVGIIDAGHFETEWPAMRKIAEILKNKFKEKGYSSKIIISENSCSPYKSF